MFGSSRQDLSLAKAYRIWRGSGRWAQGFCLRRRQVCGFTGTARGGRLGSPAELPWLLVRLAPLSSYPYNEGFVNIRIGMYNVPSFTLARAIGGLLNWYWQSYRRREETPVIVLASGLILGEGVVSIVNLLLASLKVPHL